MTNEEPYTRRPGESRQAFAAARHYFELGRTRSTARCAQDFGKSKRLMDGWSAKWRWVDRAEAYDAYQDALFDREMAAERQDAARRHIRISQLAQSKVVEGMRGLDAARLSPADLTRLLDIATKVEREALGTPRRVELSGAGGGAIDVEMEHRIGQMTEDEVYHEFFQLLREWADRSDFSVEILARAILDGAGIGDDVNRTSEILLEAYYDGNPEAAAFRDAYAAAHPEPATAGAG
jgi:hypothetical protein